MTLLRCQTGSLDLMNWNSCNAMVKGWLTSVTLDMQPQHMIFGLIFNCSSGRKKLLEHIYELRRAITMIRQKGLSIFAYYTKLCGSLGWNSVSSPGAKMHLWCMYLWFGERNHKLMWKGIGNMWLSKLKSLAQDQQQWPIDALPRGVPESATFQASKSLAHSSKHVFQNLNRRGIEVTEMSGVKKWQ